MEREWNNFNKPILEVGEQSQHKVDATQYIGYHGDKIGQTKNTWRYP